MLLRACARFHTSAPSVVVADHLLGTEWVDNLGIKVVLVDRGGAEGVL